MTTKETYDDTEFPPDSENNDEDGRRHSDSRTDAIGRRRSTDDEGDYDDKDQ